MEVDFDFTAGGMTNCGKGRKQVGIILLDRIKKRVSGGATVGIVKGGDGRGKTFGPRPDASEGPGFIRVVEWFKMVADSEEDMSFPIRGRRGATEQIGDQPFVESSHGRKSGLTLPFWLVLWECGSVHQMPPFWRRIRM